MEYPNSNLVGNKTSSPLAGGPIEPSNAATPQALVMQTQPAAPAITVTEQRHKKSYRWDIGGLILFLGSFLLMFSIWFVGPKLVEQYYYAATIGKTRAEYQYAFETLSDDPLRNVSLAYQLVAQKVRPSVVSINAIKSRRFGGGLGSGVIMSEDGYIITNAHVVEDARRFIVELYDRRNYEAALLGVDKSSDLALLKITAPNLIPAEWGNSNKVEVGAMVWAVGSPYGFQQTVTSGILSGKDRPGEGGNRKKALLQTDAAVNPGNSGGPLVDAQGKVIGINTSIFGETFQGISFAVPSATVQFVYQQLQETGKVIRGYLGVAPDEVTQTDVRRLKLTDMYGAKINRVWADSPAYRAGLRIDDVIRSWNGIPIQDFSQLFRMAETTPPSEIVEVSYFRNGREYITNIILDQFPDDIETP